MTRRFSLARVPSMFFGNGSWPRAWQKGSDRLVEDGEDARVVRVLGQFGRGCGEPVGEARPVTVLRVIAWCSRCVSPCSERTPIIGREGLQRLAAVARRFAGPAER
ncbi:hypothetical protein SSPO_096670 [Streptomyces antimycoticus]|uniref:Uncharacterized protein n=1 Tax=Streptomyces antimycoticus TaxID=68175 RepID=A0A499VDA7_9ACTN|nr:hypothetical protein SSPO_096670 [Streptomyces antimycoticus]